MTGSGHRLQPVLGVLLAMLPGLALYALLMDPQVLPRLTVLAIACGLTQWVIGHITMRKSGFSWLVTASILAIALPAVLPLPLVALAGIVAITLGRLALRGAGFNPAMLGYVTLAVLLPATMYAPPALDPVDGISGATMLTQLSDALRQQQTLSEVMAHTSLGVTPWLMAAAWIGGGLWLIRSRLLAWRIPAGVLLGLGACAVLPWMLDTDRHPSPLLHIGSGSILFAAVFVATEPGAAPRDLRTQWLYGLGIGALVYVVRRWGSYPDGIAFAVLLMNFLAPVLTRSSTMSSTGATSPAPSHLAPLTRRTLWLPTTIALVAWALLGWQHHSMQESRRMAAIQAEQQRLLALLPPQLQTAPLEFMRRDAEPARQLDRPWQEIRQTDGKLAARITTGLARGYGGEIVMQLLSDAQGQPLRSRVLVQAETPAYTGHLQERWSADLGESVDQLSGASLTAKAITAALAQAQAQAQALRLASLSAEPSP